MSESEISISSTTTTTSSSTPPPLTGFEWGFHSHPLTSSTPEPAPKRLPDTPSWRDEEDSEPIFTELRAERMPNDVGVDATWGNYPDAWEMAAQADRIEAPYKRSTKTRREIHRREGSCIICLDIWPRWNRFGGYRCYACRKSITCNRIMCLNTMYQCLLGENRCPLCRTPGSVYWHAGGDMSVHAANHTGVNPIIQRIQERFQRDEVEREIRKRRTLKRRPRKA
ncbi:hypothetical protein GMRT_25026 [Giardia muris]|uniref:Uncharacterized protein n=1 Tax=Giardia muris TaxID=5742 RepID=A0A4Z1SKG8_GIAMU|nr:hypothetical protein GMRT_25260 [Giardia muris]TNJ26120.1 hypothetical protein GMRT_16176 [Giardia muris]TNJ26122.1 hypothetical protein GMRT_25211 [Giardia muris]TNJ26139.1 hypothetical protein GMRT_25142 [Giardia muris]TNJ26157.1 hypothetical protein GMRT_25049 [Giardia muris]|eukprot:TNJ26116.1 hypothetical protein GMRT_25260 [Giardia muris]